MDLVLLPIKSLNEGFLCVFAPLREKIILAKPHKPQRSLWR